MAMITMAMQRFICILIGWWFIDRDRTNDSNNRYLSIVYMQQRTLYIYMWIIILNLFWVRPYLLVSEAQYQIYQPVSRSKFVRLNYAIELSEMRMNLIMLSNFEWIWFFEHQSSGTIFRLNRFCHYTKSLGPKLFHLFCEIFNFH